MLEKHGVVRKDSFVKAFVKIEKFLETFVDGGQEISKSTISKSCDQLETKRKVPRLVQPRKPIYNVAIGIYIHQLEFMIYGICKKLMSDAQIPVIIKGYNAFEAGDIMWKKSKKLGDFVAVTLDASRFDAHV